MLKVQNKKVVNRLSLKTLRANKKKNTVAILGIMLTAILFTAIFVIGGSMMKTLQYSTMRQVGGKSMAGVKYILPKDYQKIASDPAVKNPSYRILFANAENEELLKLTTEINYAEDNNAKNMFCYPTTGKMPEKKLEIATSTLVLDALGVPHQLGETIKLKFTVNGKNITEDFILSGYWEGDIVAMAQECFISREYCDEIAPTPEEPFYHNMYGDKKDKVVSVDVEGVDTEENTEVYMQTTEAAGYWMMEFDYANSWDIEQKTINLLERNGYNSNIVGYGVNWAYSTSTVDTGTIVFIVVLLCLIIASGYLIIYNIFSLNVIADIKSYGLLKTIGTTEKQLKKMVRTQALILSMIGIPCGMIIGTIGGRYLLPVIIKSHIINGAMEFAMHPIIFIGAALFSFGTVWLSCSKPCKIAGRVSPIEAAKYTEYSVDVKRKERKAKKVTTFSFAWANLGRSRRKVVVVVLSLSLSLILLNTIYMIISGFDKDKYMSNFLVGDAIVSDTSILHLGMNTNEHAITPEIQEELNELESVKAQHPVYLSYATIHLDNNSYNNMQNLFEEYSKYFKVDYQEEEETWIKDNHQMSCDLYGVNQYGSEQLKCYKGDIDWEKFKTGKYVCINTFGLFQEEKEPLSGMYYDVGDKIQIECYKDHKKEIKEYEVMAITKVPYAMTSKEFNIVHVEVILPETEWKAHGEYNDALMSVLEVEEGREITINNELDTYTNKIQTNLDYVSKQTYEKEFASFINMFWMVGGALCFVLALIGILNFINTIVTGILTRKTEFAMMEAVGMTGKQLKSMLIWEGLFYIILTVLCSITIGSFINGVILSALKDFWLFTGHFTILPIIACIPLLVLAAIVVPLKAYKSMVKESVVDRIRGME